MSKFAGAGVRELSLQGVVVPGFVVPGRGAQGEGG